MKYLIDKKTIGERIKKARLNCGYTQMDCFELLGGVTPQMISGWETGHNFPSLIYVPIICEKFKISANYLIFGINEPIFNENSQRNIVKMLITLFEDKYINAEMFLMSYMDLKKNTNYDLYDLLNDYIAIKNAKEAIGDEEYRRLVENLIIKYSSINLNRENKEKK